MVIKTLISSTRPSFLVLTPACVFLGLSTAIASQSEINLLLFFIILVGATCAHISVNMLNEYFDFKSGLDLITDKTAFSGGSGALPNAPKVANLVFLVGIFALIITIAIGSYLVYQQGMQILPFGIVGVLLIITYTQWLNRLPFLCLISPGLGFGILMVLGTHTLLTSSFYNLPWLISLVPFFLINNLLLLNQYPDIKADTKVGRKTFPIAFGLNKSNLVYGCFSIAAYLSIVLAIVLSYLPKQSIIAVVPILFSLLALMGALKYSSKIGNFPLYLGANVAAAILTPILLGLSIING